VSAISAPVLWNTSGTSKIRQPENAIRNRQQGEIRATDEYIQEEYCVCNRRVPAILEGKGVE
jgi:hypothetical protein